ncbi:MAG: MarR family transcriptional regulator [Rhodospirillales bacterium]|nr:MarR family transcriptional regulator [Rhodospirillales bacterium]
MSQAQAITVEEDKSTSEGQDLETLLAQWRRERPDIDPAGIAVCGAVWRAAERLRRGVLDNLTGYDLDLAGFDVIMTLRRQGRNQALSPSALAKEMMLSTSAMTNRLDRLEKRGLIRRTRDPEDRRGLKIVLSDEGFELVEGIFASHVRTVEKMLAPLRKKDRDLLTTLSQSIATGF